MNKLFNHISLLKPKYFYFMGNYIIYERTGFQNIFDCLFLLTKDIDKN